MQPGWISQHCMVCPESQTRNQQRTRSEPGWCSGGDHDPLDNEKGRVGLDRQFVGFRARVRKRSKRREVGAWSQQPSNRTGPPPGSSRWPLMSTNAVVQKYWTQQRSGKRANANIPPELRIALRGPAPSDGLQCTARLKTLGQGRVGRTLMARPHSTSSAIAHGGAVAGPAQSAWVRCPSSS